MLSSHTIAKRWRLPALLASLSLLAGLALQPVIAAKPTAVTFVDYAQCANGAPPSTALDCPEGWINGILQASNSHYAEDQVTPQRAEVLVPSGAALSHTLTFAYQTRKGSAQTHAYDSLATWNYTQTGADRNQGLNPADQVIGSATTADMPADPTVIAPFTSASGATSDHDLPDADRKFTAYGLPAGSTLSVSMPVHDCATATPTFCDDPTKDDYASVTVTYTLPNTDSARKIQFLFGGHLAVGASGGPRTWGLGLGASNISGGPYHIKWTASDGESIGNRDNQIMGSAIIFNDTGLSTTPNPSSGTVGVTLNDSADLTGATATAGGTITFNLYDDADCTAPVNYSETVDVDGPGTYATSPGFVTDSAGTWSWTASYSGDANNAASSSDCGAEEVTVDKAEPTLTTTSSVTVEVGSDIYDVAHLSGSFNATGAITFDLYGPDDATCATSIATLVATPATAGDGNYTSANFTTSTAGTYRWIAHFAGDTNNEATDTACNDANESVVVTKAEPTLTTTASGTVTVGSDIYDVAHLSGSFNATGAITFDLYGPDDATCATSIATLVATPATAGDGNYTSANFTTSTAGTYRWIAHFAGDTNNEATDTACNDANESVVVGPATPTASTTPDVQIRDNVTISGGFGTIEGTVDFALYDNDQCTGTAVFTDDDVLLENGSATSGWTTISASDTYYWQVHYDGDGLNNAAFTSACGEATTITLPLP